MESFIYKINFTYKYTYMSNYIYTEMKPGFLFTRYLIARNLAKGSTFLFYVFFIWELVYDYHSVFLAGLIPAFSLLGYMMIVIPEGHIIDRRNRSAVLFLSSILLSATYCFLFLRSSVPLILGIDLISSLLGWVSSDSFQGIIKSIVSEQGYQRAVSLNQTGTAVSEIAGILLGGAMIYLGIEYLRLVLIGMTAVSAVMAIPANIPRADSEGRHYRDALSYIRKMLFLMIISLLLNGLFISLDVYGSGLINLVMHSTAFYYTLFLVGFPIGMIIGGILISSRILKADMSLVLVTVEVTLIGTLLLAISLIRTVWIEPILTVMMGIDVMMINVQLQSFTLKVIPNELMGRYNSISVLFSAGGSPVMALIFSALSRIIYFPFVMAGAGVLAIAISPFTYAALKSMMRKFQATVSI